LRNGARGIGAFINRCASATSSCRASVMPHSRPCRAGPTRTASKEWAVASPAGGRHPIHHHVAGATTAPWT